MNWEAPCTEGLWMRRITKERLEYKSYVNSVADPGPVNAAYASQECPVCH